MEKKRRVYLGGGTVDDWRDEIERLLAPEYEVYNPMTQSRQSAIMEFTQDDIDGIRSCDLMLGVNDFESQHGLALEFGVAYISRIPIVYVAKTPRIESMMVAVAKAAFTDVEAAVAYIKRRQL